MLRGRRRRAGVIVAGGVSAALALMPLTAGAFAPMSTAQTVPVPSPAAPPPGSYHELYALKCATVEYCVGLGKYVEGVDSFPAVFAVERVDGVWEHATRIAFPPTLKQGGTDDNPDSLALSCPAVGRCIAVGEMDVSTSPTTSYEQPFTIQEKGGVWGAATPLNLAQGATDEWLSGISCPSANWCEVVGRILEKPDAWAITTTFSSGKWSAPMRFASPLSPSSQQDVFTAVSCWLQANCVAVGWDTASSIAYSPYAYGGTVIATTESAGTWGPLTPLDTDSSIDTDPQIPVAVSCPTEGICEVVGSDLPSHNMRPTSVALVGGVWGRIGLLNTAGHFVVSVSDVSCFSRSACMAIGFDGVAHSRGIIFSGSVGSALSASELPRANPSIDQVPVALSCPGAMTCVAGGWVDTPTSPIVLAQSWSPFPLSPAWSLVATRVAPHFVTIGWKPPRLKGGGLAGYDVGRVTKKGFTVIAFTTQTSFTIKNLSPKTAYVFGVVAVSKNKQASAVVSRTVKTT